MKHLFWRFWWATISISYRRNGRMLTLNQEGYLVETRSIIGRLFWEVR